MIKILLLVSLLFNISHASFIAMIEECHHEHVIEYTIEQNSTDDCGDLCDIDYLFHFIAILTTPNIGFDTSIHNEKLILKTTLYYPPFKEKTTKPPIV